MKRLQIRTSIAFLLILMLSLATSEIHAQKKVYKLGDRVLVSPTGLKDEKYWRPGTITEIHDYVPQKAYSVKCDPQNGGTAPVFVVHEEWIKPLTAVNKPEQQPATVQQPPNTPGTKPVMAKVACPPSDADSKGRTAFEQEIRGAIRKDFEREPAINADGRVTITFQGVNIGAAHSWQSDLDPQEARGKSIYAVRADFTTCTDYNRRIVIVKMERAFGCYESAGGKWACDVVAAANTNVKDQSRSVDKAER